MKCYINHSINPILNHGYSNINKLVYYCIVKYVILTYSCCLIIAGIYLDLDVLVTKSFNDLRHYACTIGQEQDTKACGQLDNQLTSHDD